MAENGVKLAKNMLKKADHLGTDVYLLLLEYRTTPITGTSFSPSQLLMGRQLKTKLPTSSKLLKPTTQINVRETLKSLQDTQKYFHDKQAKSLPALTKDQSILIRNDKIWQPAVVVSRHDTPRSYLVQREDGSVLRRNRRDLMPSLNKFHLKSELLHDELETDDPKVYNSTGGKEESYRDIVNLRNESVPSRVASLPIEPRVSGRIRKAPDRFKDFVMR